MIENPWLVAALAITTLTIIGAALSHFWPQIQESLKARETKPIVRAEPTFVAAVVQAPIVASEENNVRMDAFGKVLHVRDTIKDLAAPDPATLQQNTEYLAAALTQTKGKQSE